MTSVRNGLSNIKSGGSGTGMKILMLTITNMILKTEAVL